MTVAPVAGAAEASSAAPARVLSWARPKISIETLTIAIALLGAVAYVMPDGLAISQQHVLLALLSTVPVLLVLRPLERLPLVTVALPAACALGAGVVLLAAPAGWSSSQFAGLWVYAAVAFVVVAAYADTPERLTRVAVLLAAFGVYELELAFRGWIHAGNPNLMMSGSVGWHNQFAAFLLGPGVVALAMYVLKPASRWSLPWALVSAASGTAIVLSTSRACLGLFALAWLAVGAFAARSEGRAGALLRWASAPLLVLLGVRLFTSTVFFGHHAYQSPLTGDGARGPSTLAGNGAWRKDYILAGLQIFQHHPVVGTGFGSFPHAAAPYLGHSRQPIFGVYDYWVDALMSGGLVFALPVTVASLGVGVVLARLGRRAISAGGSDGALRLGVLIATIVVIGHVVFDVDTYYMQVMAMLGALLGLAYAAGRVYRVTPPGAHATRS